MRRESPISLHARVVQGAIFGTSGLFPQQEALSLDESSTTTGRSKALLTVPDMPSGTYSVSFYSQHKTNNSAANKYSRGAFLLDGEEVVFGENATKEWSPFSDILTLELTSGTHTFELRHRAVGGVGVSIMRSAKIYVFLRNL